jgi:uncharacterized HhH-GPD family protein
MTGLIFNQGIDSRRAFENPKKLRERLEISKYDLFELSQPNGYDKLLTAMMQTPCLHRFPSVMATNVFAFAQKITSEYDGDPRNIWHNQNVSNILKRLQSFRGVGYHKSIQCLFFLKELDQLGEELIEYKNYMEKNCSNFFLNIYIDIQSILDVG